MNEAQIIKGLRACSAEAHEALYDEYAADLYDYCHALLGDDTAAAGALRETLLRAAASTGSIPAGHSLRAWLFALARGQCRSGGDQLIEHPMPEDDPSGRLLVAVLGTLTARDREVLELTGRHGLSEADLEPILGLPSDRGASLLAEARGRFDQAMAEELDRTGPVAFPSLAGLAAGEDPLPLLYAAIPAVTPPPASRGRTLDDLLITGTTGRAAPFADTGRRHDPFREPFGGGSFDAFGAASSDAARAGSARELDDEPASAAAGGEVGGAGGGHRHDRPKRRVALVGGAAAGAIVVAAGIAFAVGTAGDGPGRSPVASRPSWPARSTVDATGRSPSGPARHTGDPRHTSIPDAAPTPPAGDTARHGSSGSPEPHGDRTRSPAHRGRDHQGRPGSGSAEPPPSHGHRPPPSTNPPTTSHPPTGSPTPSSPTPTTTPPKPTTESATPPGSPATAR